MIGADNEQIEIGRSIELIPNFCQQLEKDEKTFIFKTTPVQVLSHFKNAVYMENQVLNCIQTIQLLLFCCSVNCNGLAKVFQ